MAKVVLIFRNGFDSKYLARELIDKNPGETIYTVLELGTTARKAKLHRYLGNSPRRKFKALFLDLPFLLTFHCIQNFFVKRKLGINKKSSEYPNLIIDSVNDEELLYFLRLNKIDAILNYGTSIYGKSTLEQIEVPIVNLHTGILPKYRNVHTDFWAYLKDDFSGIGVTAFLITPEIDRGYVLESNQTKINQEDFLWDVKRLNLLSTVTVADSIVKKFSQTDWGVLRDPMFKRNAVDSEDYQGGTLWPTPRANDLGKLFKKELLKCCRAIRTRN